MVILAIAIGFNALFSWRNYPVSLVKVEKTDAYAPINHEDFVYALSQIDSIVDISEADLVKIYSLATMHSNKDKN